MGGSSRRADYVERRGAIDTINRKKCTNNKLENTAQHMKKKVLTVLTWEEILTNQ